MLKFGHPEDEKKETGQHKMQEMCSEAVHIEPRSLVFVPDHFKRQEMCDDVVWRELYTVICP